MINRYANLLSPFKVGNVVFRNRLFTAPMGLHALQGGELYPTEAKVVQAIAQFRADHTAEEPKDDGK